MAFDSRIYARIQDCPSVCKFSKLLLIPLELLKIKFSNHFSNFGENIKHQKVASIGSTRQHDRVRGKNQKNCWHPKRRHWWIVLGRNTKLLRVEPITVISRQRNLSGQCLTNTEVYRKPFLHLDICLTILFVELYEKAQAAKQRAAAEA